MHAITKKCYDKADNYQPIESRKYAWVWSYALFRFEWASESVRRIEDKALELTKFTLTLGLALWGIFSFLRPHMASLKWQSEVAIILALDCLLTATLCFIGAYLPSKHLAPVAEDSALRHADAYEDPEGAQAKFSQQFASSTEYQKYLLTQKGGRIQIGTFLLFAWATLLFTAFLCEMSR